MKRNVHIIYYLLFFLLSLLVTGVCFSQSGFPYTYGENMMYFPKLADRVVNINAIKDGLGKSLPHAVQVYDVRTGKTYDAKDIKSFTVSHDRIEVVVKKRKDNLVWLFSSIDDSTMIFFGKQNAGTFVFLPGVANFGFIDFNAAQLLADNIYAIQYPVINRIRDSILTAFRSRVVLFRNSNRIATPNEDQISLFKKADSVCEYDDHFEGIRTYLKAIAIDEMSYTTAYANLALLYAHINYFDYAILYMKQYLMLETDVEKQRGGLDKLYEWEGIIHY
jgi:hypothetical protein